MLCIYFLCWKGYPYFSKKKNKFESNYPTLLYFTTWTFVSFAQQTSQLHGTYVSERKYNDVWTLKLNSDSSYSFQSQQGESLFPGKWKAEEKVILLSGESSGKVFAITLKITKRQDQVILISRRKDFIKLTLSKR